MSEPVGLADVVAAQRRLEGVVQRTPVLTSDELSRRIGAQLHFKCEQLQRGGSFKLRGAYNCAALATAGSACREVIAFSSGNHALALAIAADALGLTAHVVMPSDAPRVKLDATRWRGANVIEFDRLTQSRDELLAREAERTGAIVVPAYDHPDVIAGQGTVGLELMLDRSLDLDAVLVPLGGGGLAAGCAIAVTALNPATRVIGVEPRDADDWARSLARGERVRIPPPCTIADGLRTPSPGAVTFPLLQRRLDGVVTVSDEELLDAMACALRHLKLVIEPSAAAPLAALLSDRLPQLRGRKVGIVLSGGNVDASTLQTALARSA